MLVAPSPFSKYFKQTTTIHNPEEISFRDSVVTVEIVDIKGNQAKQLSTLEEVFNLALVRYIVQRGVKVEEHGELVSYHYSVPLGKAAS